MSSITKCTANKSKCLIDGVCCYVCDFKHWCEMRCVNDRCRRNNVMQCLKMKGGQNEQG